MEMMQPLEKARSVLFLPGVSLSLCHLQSTQSKSKNESVFLVRWNIELHKSRDRDHDNGNVRQNVHGDGDVVVHCGIDTRAREGPVPELVYWCAREDADEVTLDGVDYDDDNHGPSCNFRLFSHENTEVLGEDRELGESNCRNVEPY